MFKRGGCLACSNAAQGTLALGAQKPKHLKMPYGIVVVVTFDPNLQSGRWLVWAKRDASMGEAEEHAVDPHADMDSNELRAGEKDESAHSVTGPSCTAEYVASAWTAPTNTRTAAALTVCHPHRSAVVHPATTDGRLGEIERRKDARLFRLRQVAGPDQAAEGVADDPGGDERRDLGVVVGR